MEKQKTLSPGDIQSVEWEAKTSENSYDAIVVGSGIGGLAAASVLSQIHKMRVLLLEKHYVLGGFTHTFSRKGYTWDVGLHYVGQMGPDDSIRRASDFITQGQVEWKKMQSPFETFRYPEFRLDVSDDPKAYLEELARLFPDDAENLKKYFKDIKRIPFVVGLQFLPGWMRILMKPFIWRRSQLAQKTVASYLQDTIQDPKLRSLLCSQWGDYGLPPATASMLIHSMIINHYLLGAYYPVGGGQVIADTIEKIIEKFHGVCLLRSAVNELLIEGSSIQGVRVKNQAGQVKDYFAPIVFSNIGVQGLYKMIPEKFISSKVQSELKNISPGTSAVVLYLGLKQNPNQLEIHGQNFWIYDNWDHDKMWDDSDQLLNGKASHCYVSFPSLKDPKAHKPTAEVIAFVSASFCKKWEGSSWRKRPEDYEVAKKAITQALMNLVEREIPGFKDLVDFAELSTPLSTEHFTSHQHGQIYGLPANPKRLRMNIAGTKTPIKGLYNVGADVIGHGIAGAMMGGILSVASALGWKTMGQVMKKKK
jgi:all-trans-retinol 13,14-reductase